MKRLAEHQGVAEEEKDLLTRCRNALESIDPSVEVILYGSRARGDAEPESDYDLLILTNREASLEKEDVFRQQLYPLEIQTGCVFTVILISRRKWNSALYGVMPFYQNVERDGVIL